MPAKVVDASALAAVLFGEPAYDASYLWLSQKLGLELVTTDGALKRAAEAPSE